MKYSKLQPPTEFYATKGDDTGEIKLQWDSVNGASKYLVQKSSNNSKKNWNHVDIVTESCCTVTGLRPSRKYAFRVAAINGSGQSSWSKEIEKKFKQ
ncbi:MAG: fibronectin type III domain-containing protein [Ignavibacteria bacterium]|nr:fibronectin type III domain-containing protein [Ignavibacteria bacterium]